MASASNFWNFGKIMKLNGNRVAEFSTILYISLSQSKMNAGFHVENIDTHSFFFSFVALVVAVGSVPRLLLIPILVRSHTNKRDIFVQIYMLSAT